MDHDDPGPVTFMVDTGSEITTLSLIDASRLGVDLTRIGDHRTDMVTGIGDTESPIHLKGPSFL